jgi:hypothetical protein
MFANDQWEEFDTVLSIMHLSCDYNLHATVSKRMNCNELWTKTESDITIFIHMTARAFLLTVLSLLPILFATRFMGKKSTLLCIMTSLKTRRFE